MDGGAWWAAVHEAAKSRTRLSNFTFTFHFPALEKEMATHSSVLASRIPGTGEPGGLPSMGSHRVGHDWSDLAAAAIYFHHPQCSRDCTLVKNVLGFFQTQFKYDFHRVIFSSLGPAFLFSFFTYNFSVVLEEHWDFLICIKAWF